MDWETACKTLKLEQKHTERCLKKAYYKQALKYHPDKNKSKDAETNFKQISEAYQVLMNNQLRNDYDKYGTTPNKFKSLIFSSGKLKLS